MLYIIILDENISVLHLLPKTLNSTAYNIYNDYFTIMYGMLPSIHARAFNLYLLIDEQHVINNECTKYFIYIHAYAYIMFNSDYIIYIAIPLVP